MGSEGGEGEGEAAVHRGRGRRRLQCRSTRSVVGSGSRGLVETSAVGGQAAGGCKFEVMVTDDPKRCRGMGHLRGRAGRWPGNSRTATGVSSARRHLVPAMGPTRIRPSPLIGPSCRQSERNAAPLRLVSVIGPLLMSPRWANRLRAWHHIPEPPSHTRKAHTWVHGTAVFQLSYRGRGEAKCSGAKCSGGGVRARGSCGGRARQGAAHPTGTLPRVDHQRDTPGALAGALAGGPPPPVGGGTRCPRPKVRRGGRRAHVTAQIAPPQTVPASLTSACSIPRDCTQRGRGSRRGWQLIWPVPSSLQRGGTPPVTSGLLGHLAKAIDTSRQL